MALELVTAEDLRKAIPVLVKLVEPVLGDWGNGDHAEILEDCVANALQTLEDELGTYWQKKVIRQTLPVAGETYDVIEPAFDYYPVSASMTELPSWTLRKRPVFSIQKVCAQYGPGQIAWEAPMDRVDATWARVDYKLGTVALMPTANAVAIYTGAWLVPLMRNMQPRVRVPQFWAIDYTAGWYDPDADALPDGSDAIRRGIAATAAIDYLDRVGSIIPQNASLDGFSQGFVSVDSTYKNLQTRADTFRSWWNSHDRPPRMFMA